MTISSRTPEGQPNRCPVCGQRLRLSPSWPSADAPCPSCGSLVWFSRARVRRAKVEPPSAVDFTLEDFRKHLEQLKRTGAIGEVEPEAEEDLRHIQGMLDAMTTKERRAPDVLNESRRRRIATGAGLLPKEVEKFLRQFQRVRALMNRMAQMSIWSGGA
jgi:signal recognition particle GTPase